MQKLTALLVVALSSVTLHAQWIFENFAPNTGPRTGIIVNLGLPHSIGPGANLQGANLRGADLGEANLRGANLTGANLDNADLWETIWNSPDPRIAELEAQLAAVTAERDAAISERDARPTLAEVQDARAGSLVFRADEETNAVTLEFEIQSSENLQDWVAQPEKVTATVPLDAEKKFVRIALAQERTAFRPSPPPVDTDDGDSDR